MKAIEISHAELSELSDELIKSSIVYLYDHDYNQVIGVFVFGNFETVAPRGNTDDTASLAA